MNQVTILKLEGHHLALLGSLELSYNADLQNCGEGVLASLQ